MTETGPAVSYKDSKSTQSEVDKETTSEKKVATTKSSLDVEAEKDSKKRKESVNKVCQKINVINVLEPPTNRRDRKSALQRFNLFHHLIVNEEHKVLYCFMPKVGCSNMKRIFVVMEGLYPSVEKVNIHIMNQEIVRLDNKKFTTEQQKYMLKNFYKFMIVRDPFERLVSAYRNKWQNKRNIELHAHLGKTIIEKYRYNNTRTVETGNDMSFTEYARYLIDSPPWEVNEHWMQYEELCRPCNVKYDFIGSIDTLSRDVTHAMRQIHVNETKHHLVHMRGTPLTKSKQTTADFLKELPRKYFDQLMAIYKTDHELFGYPLPKYETLDKRYTSPGENSNS
ncbi:carbohydrate sulfotransferase 14 [Paramuricea clavata]|uniref:Carbohydrate sulfotransferase n=1 Tax=Paramuricea clavata TaxID=317549 RepID=A0A6S7HAS9_PARCT|nr:carbohydrate sulfotransferase 14 [Paramuricea clavata]